MLDYFKNREWAATIGVLASIVAALPVIAELVSGELEAAGNDWNWSMLMPVLAGLVIRFNVWSNRSAAQAAAGVVTPPQL